MRHRLSFVAFLVLFAPAALGCEEPLLAPPSLPTAPPASVIAEASLALSAPEGPRSPPGAPAELRAPEPTLVDLIDAARAGDLRAELSELIGQPVREPPASGVTIEASEEGRVARLVVRAPDRATALVTCRAFAQLASAHAQRPDPAEAWLLTETARLEREIAALDRQLALLPGAPWSLPRSRDEALTDARVRRMEAKAERRMQQIAPPNATFPIVRALAQLAREAQAEELAARALGHGAEHPELRALAARAAWYSKQIDARWIVEQEGAERVVDAILALPARADRRAVAHALAARLRTSAVEQACSLDPASLQVLALTHARLRATEAELSPRYGAKHPQRLVLSAQLAALAAAFNTERDTLAALIEREGAAPLVDTRPDELRDKAVLLTATLARLVRHREEARPPRWSPLAPCHLR